MKKGLLLILVIGSVSTGCLPAFLQPEAAPTIPLSDADLNATAAVLSEQTLRALPLPSATSKPSNTPVITNPTETKADQTASPTDTTTTITVTGGSDTASTTATATETASATSTPTLTAIPSAVQIAVTVLPGTAYTSTNTLSPRFYGTLPPNLPSGKIVLVNKSKSEVYISLQCTTSEGYVTILEYPVEKRLNVKGPAGSYGYVAWVGGRKISGGFHLGIKGEVVLTIFKDRIEVK
jgi:hypothetical protein